MSERIPKQWIVLEWDICMYLNAMNDFGRGLDGKFGRAHTNNAECYAAQDGIPCDRQGHCIKARLRKRRKYTRQDGERRAGQTSEQALPAERKKRDPLDLFKT